MDKIHKSLNLPKVSRRIQEPSRLPARLASSLLPGIRDLLSDEQYNWLDGRLRRGDLSALNASFLTEKLDGMRYGRIDCSHNAFYRLYQFVSFLKKYPIKGNDTLCRNAGLEKFKQGELQCKTTNMRLTMDKTKHQTAIVGISRIIHLILGEIPADLHDRPVTFGPGSTVNPVDRSYDESCEFFKLSDPLYVPERQVVDLKVHMSKQYQWIESLAVHYHINRNGLSWVDYCNKVFEKHLVVVPDDFGNKISFVPKNQNEHRAIGVELSGSILLQKLVGDEIRRKLSKFGLPLDSQSRNVHFAKVAQTFGFATVDLANASNTLSRATVKLLLSSDWYAVMDCFRSHTGQTKSGDYKTLYEMFSSMGNGFTFELESLIFYAICLYSVQVDQNCSLYDAKRQVATYGDDLIVPSHSYALLVKHLNLFGFSVNHEKSFTNGKFFESCGSDFFDSFDVRPFFLKREISRVSDVYFLCNSLLWYATKRKSDFLFPAYIVALREMLKLNVPPDFGPLHFYNGRDGWQETHDDLEAVLRVPLDFAQRNGGIRFDVTVFGWRYRKWVKLALEIPLSKNSQYHVQNMKYLTFLRGHRGGKAVYKSRTRLKLVHRVSSNWNGSLSTRDLALVERLFEQLS